MGKVFKIDKKGLKRGFWVKKIRFQLEKNMRESKIKKKEKKKKRNPSLSLRSTEFRWLEFVGPRTKVHLLDEGYVWVPKP